MRRVLVEVAGAFVQKIRLPNPADIPIDGGTLRPRQILPPDFGLGLVLKREAERGADDDVRIAV